MMNKVEFAKTMPVKSPSRAHGNDAGADLFVPDWSLALEEALKNKNEKQDIQWRDEKNNPCIVLAPGARVLIPSGLRMHILDEGTYIKIENKSGVASKKGLVVGANVIDAGYTGVVHINLINASSKEVRIDYGEKIVQAIQMPYVVTDYQEVDEETIDNVESDRKSGGFGSTGTK